MVIEDAHECPEHKIRKNVQHASLSPKKENKNGQKKQQHLYIYIHSSFILSAASVGAQTLLVVSLEVYAPAAFCQAVFRP